MYLLVFQRLTYPVCLGLRTVVRVGRWLKDSLILYARPVGRGCAARVGFIFSLVVLHYLLFRSISWVHQIHNNINSRFVKYLLGGFDKFLENPYHSGTHFGWYIEYKIFPYNPNSPSYHAMRGIRPCSQSVQFATTIYSRPLYSPYLLFLNYPDRHRLVGSVLSTPLFGR